MLKALSAMSVLANVIVAVVVAMCLSLFLS